MILTRTGTGAAQGTGWPARKNQEQLPSILVGTGTGFHVQYNMKRESAK
tara:strand:- start:3026 stop:3172 length:147 start_codon:yes stop_codon:yes gene_type:complete